MVLGSGIFGTAVPPLLGNRIRKGIQLQHDAPHAVLILSGGQGPGEDIPEGVYRICVPEGGWSASMKMSTESGEEKRFAVSEDSPVGKVDLTGYKYITFSSTVIFYAYTGLFN